MSCPEVARLLGDGPRGCSWRSRSCLGPATSDVYASGASTSIRLRLSDAPAASKPVMEGIKSMGTIGWLRRLHRSHSPQTGPFSTCMYRTEAATVSYTEIDVFRQRARLRHVCGPACSGSPATLHEVVVLPDAGRWTDECDVRQHLIPD